MLFIAIFLMKIFALLVANHLMMVSIAKIETLGLWQIFDHDTSKDIRNNDPKKLKKVDWLENRLFLEKKGLENLLQYISFF